jgi:SAM-dependent methyltransferase
MAASKRPNCTTCTRVVRAATFCLRSRTAPRAPTPPACGLNLFLVCLEHTLCAGLVFEPFEHLKHDAFGLYTVQVCTADSLLCTPAIRVFAETSYKFTYNRIATAAMFAGGCCDISHEQIDGKGVLMTPVKHIDTVKAAALLQLAGPTTLPPAARVLELACGLGYMSSLLAPHFPPTAGGVPRYFCIEPDHFLTQLGSALFRNELGEQRPVLLDGMSRDFFAIPRLLAAMPPNNAWRQGSFDLIVSREFFLHLPPAQLPRALWLLKSLLTPSSGRIIAAVGVDDAEWCDPHGSEAWERTLHSSFTQCAFCMAAASFGFRCTWLTELRGMFFLLQGREAREQWVLLTPTSDPASAAGATQLRAVPNTDISYGEDCCVFRRSADNPLTTQLLPDSADGRCWYARLEDAERVCSMFRECVGVVRDNSGYEPRRGPALLTRSRRPLPNRHHAARTHSRMRTPERAHTYHHEKTLHGSGEIRFTCTYAPSAVTAVAERACSQPVPRWRANMYDHSPVSDGMGLCRSYGLGWRTISTLCVASQHSASIRSW